MPPRLSTHAPAGGGGGQAARRRALPVLISSVFPALTPPPGVPASVAPTTPPQRDPALTSAPTPDDRTLPLCPEDPGKHPPAGLGPPGCACGVTG